MYQPNEARQSRAGEFKEPVHEQNKQAVSQSGGDALEIFPAGVPSTSTAPPLRRPTRSTSSSRPNVYPEEIPHTSTAPVLRPPTALAAAHVGRDFKYMKLHREYTKKIEKFNSDSWTLEFTFVEDAEEPLKWLKVGLKSAINKLSPILSFFF